MNLLINPIGFLKIRTSAVSGPIVKLKTFSWLQFGKKNPTPLTSRCQGRNPKVCQVNHCYCWWWRKSRSAHNNRQFLPLFAKILYILPGSMRFLPSGCGYNHKCHNAQWLNIYEPFQPTSKQITKNRDAELPTFATCQSGFKGIPMLGKDVSCRKL